VAYNYLYCPAFYAFGGYGGCTNQKIHNNFLRRDDEYPSLRNDSSSECKNNIMYTYAYGGSLTPDANGNLVLNHNMDTTVFANPAGGNYHLKAGSPAINAGLNLGYTVDLAGIPVPQGGAPDIGCFEYTPPLLISLAADWNWVYQNYAVTTLDRHHCVLTVAVSQEAIAGESYTASFTENGGPLVNFTLQTTAQPLVFNLVGGRGGSTTPAAYNIAVTLTGLTSGQSVTSATVPVQLRKLGDITADGKFNTLDKNAMNLRVLGNLNTGYPERAFDLNGDGKFNTLDKNIMNLIVLGTALQ